MKIKLPRGGRSADQLLILLRARESTGAKEGELKIMYGGTDYSTPVPITIKWGDGDGVFITLED